ncbi:MAG: hypothetical protein LBJ21_00560 [Acidobacteriota bacterium]|jgi:hypothetical protein|nr:hypothetical protein [Acidobacteriota bacterium]
MSSRSPMTSVQHALSILRGSPIPGHLEDRQFFARRLCVCGRFVDFSAFCGAKIFLILFPPEIRIT